MRPVLYMTKALSDENRLRALMALGRGELCVCQIVELLDLAPSTVSKHMSVLLHADLVERRKQGRWIYYRLAEGERSAELIAWLQRHLADDAALRNDRARLEEIVAIDPEKLCRIQAQK